MKSAKEVVAHLHTLADQPTATHLQRFFKTEPGGYGAGDQFLGIRVPELRTVARALDALPGAEVPALLHSPWHEARLAALLAMVRRFQRGNRAAQEELHALYLENLAAVNNWDLVDSSAEQLAGAPVLAGWVGEELIFRFQQAEAVWPRRIAVVAMFHFIKQRKFELPVRVLEAALEDPHPLMHKAAGWMWREIGKRERAVLETALARHGAHMPRTTLRYAVERFTPEERAGWMQQTKARGSSPAGAYPPA